MTCTLTKTRGCNWCEKRLTGKQRKWCSRTCARKNRINHRWTDAKDNCRKQAAWYMCAICEYMYQQHDINVDHIEPAMGKHGQWSCSHHADNLRVLCVPCHKQVTKEQHANGALKRN